VPGLASIDSVPAGWLCPQNDVGSAHSRRRTGFWSRENVRRSGDALELRLTRSGRRWVGAEVFSHPFRGEGEVTFAVDGLKGPLHPCVVVGLFVYERDRSDLDVELARFDGPTEPPTW
jgi:hypothetical protein